MSPATFCGRLPESTRRRLWGGGGGDNPADKAEIEILRQRTRLGLHLISIGAGESARCPIAQQTLVTWICADFAHRRAVGLAPGHDLETVPGEN
jgi:hypothetical protein